MTQELWTSVDDYFTSLLAPSDAVLDAVLAASSAAGLPAINVAPNQGKFLQLLAQSHGARTILEIGTLGGYSTIWLARALPVGGRLITLESEPKHVEMARANFTRAGLAGVVTLRLGPASESLAQLAAERCPPFDMIFIDADKPGYTDYLAWSLKLSRPGTLIIADNVVRDGEIIDANSEDEKVKGIRRFNAALAANPRINATAIQTVGSKGYDGFVIGVVIS